MNVPVRTQEIVESAQNRASTLRVDVVEKAVDEDEVELPVLVGFVRANVRRDELPSIAAAREGDVVLVPVESDVVRVLEERRVDPGAAAHVENAAGRSEIVVTAQRNEFLRRVGRLPEAINGDVLQKRGPKG